MFYSTEDFLKDMNNISETLKKENFDYIVCPLRGAMSIAQILSYKLDIKSIFTINIKRFKVQNDYAITAPVIDDLDKNLKALIVDDILDTGLTMKYLKDNIPNSKIYTIFYNTKTECQIKPDFYSRESDGEWIDFWWEKMNS